MTVEATSEDNDKMQNIKYKSSPLKEVVFEALIDDSRLLEITEIEQFLQKKGYASKFPETQNRFRLEGKLEIKGNQPIADSRNYHDGFTCLSKDNKKALIIRPNGFGLVFLKPYVGWDESFNEFSEYIDTAVNFFKIKSLTRLAVRSINHIDFNNELMPKDFDLQIDYKIENLNSAIQSSVNQKSMNIFCPIPNLKVNVIEALNFKDLNPVLKRFILDIDVFTENIFNTSEIELKDIFAEIRKTKNSIFESYLKDKSREYFDK